LKIVKIQYNNMNIILNLKKQNFNKEQIREILIEIIHDILNDAKLSDISKSYNIEICDIYNFYLRAILTDQKINNK